MDSGERLHGRVVCVVVCGLTVWEEGMVGMCGISSTQTPPKTMLTRK